MNDLDEVRKAGQRREDPSKDKPRGNQGGRERTDLAPLFDLSLDLLVVSGIDGNFKNPARVIAVG